MLTPLDIQKQDFEVKLRGYNADEVDDFLDLVGADYEKLYKDNLELREKVTALTGDINRYKKMEDTLQNAMILAQKTADDIKTTANAQAEEILNDAHKKASAILSQADQESLSKNSELAKIKSEIGIYKTKIKTLLDLLEKME